MAGSPVGEAKTERTSNKGDDRPVELRTTLPFVLGKGTFRRILCYLFPKEDKSRRLHEEASGFRGWKALVEAV